MRIETRDVTVGEWLGDVPEDWDYEGFYKRHLEPVGLDKDQYVKSISLFKEMDAALKEGKEVYATKSGDFTNKVYSCGLYDGWVFWSPRPCYLYEGPLLRLETGDFYNILAIRIADSIET